MTRHNWRPLSRSYWLLIASTINIPILTSHHSLTSPTCKFQHASEISERQASSQSSPATQWHQAYKSTNEIAVYLASFTRVDAVVETWRLVTAHPTWKSLQLLGASGQRRQSNGAAAGARHRWHGQLGTGHEHIALTQRSHHWWRRCTHRWKQR